ncbi:ubiquinol-cytochrome c reductase cytochrome b subunit [Streptomyces albofaciens JCM 4342]|uniref:cytochrome bc1 complex cytochrome b subunit n=1 Tax=Streptomyces albofaciens TaxID=66866 RepID=UPI001239641C|nr:ubiquinol-cytochrome c reductase cytochrome b subunit [Streptomyces albofaciens]KAA6212299.1 ubiquinol-cytochrome c reductase cytochrome b subunit [Streptomyces albofaciens JCM 4342]
MIFFRRSRLKVGAAERGARRVAGRSVGALDARLPVAEGGGLLRKAFPGHWSFLLGELALYSLLVLVLTGVYLTLFFKPEMREVTYDGSYQPLSGVRMSHAFSSTLRISFDVRGGLLIRQMHHWAAIVFVAAIGVHLLRVFFTGAFRKPREVNWMVGVTLFLLALAEGFAGYSLPDDLLSGTGLRIAQGIMLSVPVAGTYLSMFAFGAEFPGEDIVARLYALHVLLLPGLILALVTLHLLLVLRLKHTQWSARGRTNSNVVGKPLFPHFAATSGGLFCVVFGLLAALGGLAQVNPVWVYGPYRPDQASTGAQPDWYVGFLEGALRLVPPWETTLAGHTVMWNVLLPAVVLPLALFAVLYAYPFVEAWVTGDRREHHLCDRPRDRPVRTGLGVAAVTGYGVLLLAGGNDVVAHTFGISLNALTWVLRVALVVLPVVAFRVAKGVCLALREAEHERLAEGTETGQVRQTISGGYEETHRPADEEQRYAALHGSLPAVPREPDDAPDDGTAVRRARGRLRHWFTGSPVPRPRPAGGESQPCERSGGDASGS